MARKPRVTTQPTEPPVPASEPHPSGWGHDWRNPSATFATDDRCINAELSRLHRRG